jgi:hypothetical protein
MSNDLFQHQFIPARMKDLESVSAEVLAFPLFEDERPPRGLAGLVDWRMDGLLSRIRVTTVHPEFENPHYRSLALGPFGAALNEKLLFPPGRWLPFDRVLVVGLGPKPKYDGQAYRSVVKDLLGTVTSMRVGTLALQLPGWRTAGVPARRAADVFVSELISLKRREAVTPSRICFIEELDCQAEMDEKLLEALRSYSARE